MTARKKTVRRPTGLPTEISVLGKKFTIEYTNDMNKDEYGETDLELKKIKLNSNRPKHTWRATLLHEVIHAILGVTGQSNKMTDDEEEGLVVSLENGLEDLVDFKDF